MSNRRNVSGTRIIYGIFAFISCWYFYFASTIILRPFPQLFWIFMATLSLFLGMLHKFKLDRSDLYFFLGMVILVLFSGVSVNPTGSIQYVANYVIYYMVARMIAKNCEGKIIHTIILTFSVFHMICIYIQVLMPSLYTSLLLPLLPASSHTMLTEQMDWNAAYYGFSIQSSMSAMYLSMGAILSALKVRDSKKKVSRICYLILTILFLVATFYTQRRGSSVVTLVVLMLIYLTAKGSTISKVLFGITVILLVAVIGIQNIPGVAGLMNKFATFIATGSLMNGRDSNFADAIVAIAKRPFFGYGGGQVETATGYAWLENSYLSILVQWGIIGAIAFFLPYWRQVKKTIFQNKSCKLNNIYSSFSSYIQILFFLMSLVENYFGEPLNIFIYFLIVFAGNKYWENNKFLYKDLN